LGEKPAEILIEGLHVFMDQGVVVEQNGKLPQFGCRGQTSMDQEVGRLLESGLLGKLFNGDAPIAQNPFFAVHVGDTALAGPGVGIAWIKRNEAGFRSETGNIDGALALAANDNRQFVCFPIVNQFDVIIHMVLFTPSERLTPVFDKKKF
jgi:hypothetical protein